MEVSSRIQGNYIRKNKGEIYLTQSICVLESSLEAHRAMDKKEITQWALGEWEDRDDDLVRWMTEGTSPHMGPRSDCG